MINIASKDNEKIKTLRKLKQRKFRDKCGRFLVENLSIIHDAATAGIYAEALFVTQEFLVKNEAAFAVVLEKSAVKEYYLISPAVNASFSNLEKPAGICAVYAKPKGKINMQRSVVYLNGINDPGNLGTILRSALAFSLLEVVVDEKTADVYNPKTVHAAKDAIFKINIECDKGRTLLRALKKKMPLYVTRVDAGEDVAEVEKRRSFCLVLGSEAHGVDQEILAMADSSITLKINPAIESLNVASAAAIIFYELGKR